QPLTTGMVSKGPGNDAFVAKLDAMGNRRWSKSFHGFDATNRSFIHVAVDPTGNVILVGGYVGGVDFGCGLITSPGPVAMDVFVAKLDAMTGSCLWSHKFGDSGNQAGFVASTDDAGNIFVTGTFDGNVDFGGGNLSNPNGPKGDTFIVKLDPGGNHIWS